MTASSNSVTVRTYKDTTGEFQQSTIIDDDALAELLSRSSSRPAAKHGDDGYLFRSTAQHFLNKEEIVRVEFEHDCDCSMEVEGDLTLIKTEVDSVKDEDSGLSRHPHSSEPWSGVWYKAWSHPVRYVVAPPNEAEELGRITITETGFYQIRTAISLKKLSVLNLLARATDDES